MEQDERDYPPRSKEDVLGAIMQAKKHGSTYLEIIGGEATIRTDLLEIIRFAKKLGFETVMIATNGRMLSYKEYAYNLIEAGLNSIVFSIHGHDEKTHDHLTRSPGSFEQLQKGLRNVQEAIDYFKKDVHIGSNTTIVKPNYRSLPKIGEYIRSHGITNSEFIFVDCTEGGAYNNFEQLVPKVSEAAPYIKECLDLLDVENTPRSNWDVRYVPLCLFPKHLNQISEVKEVKVFETAQIGRGSSGAGEYNYQEKRKNMQRIKPEKCMGCALYDYCEGVWTTYFEKYGDEELSPLTEITKEQEKKLNFI